jgi:hypothetical protein
MGFSIRPGMSTWVDMPDEYKQSYYKKFEPENYREGIYHEAPPQPPKPQPNEILEMVVTEEVIKLVDEIETCSCGFECHCDEPKVNTCQVCGIKIPVDKKFCGKDCFYNRFK